MTRTSRRTTFRPRVERLEDRTVPSFLPVGNEFQVNTTTAGDQIDPTIAAAPDGHFVVVYATPSLDSGSPMALVARIFNADGTPATGEIPVNQSSVYSVIGQPNGPPSGPPSVAMDAQGDFVVTWLGWFPVGVNSYQISIIGRRFSASGAPLSDQFEVSLPGAMPLLNPPGPVVAMDSQGGFVIGWDQQPFTAQTLMGRLYDSTGQPVADPFQVASLPTTATAIAVAMDSGGDFTFAWTNTDIFAQRYNAAGVAQGSAFQVNQVPTGVQDKPGVAVAMDSTGNSVIAWVGDGHQEILGRQFNSSGQAVANPFRVNGGGFVADLVDPHAAMNAGGSFVITWANGATSGIGAATPNPENLDVFAKLFDAAGVDHSGDFIVNQSVPASYPGVAIDTAGGFLFAWQSSGQDGDGAGILARRYITNSTGYDAQLSSGNPALVMLTISVPYSNNAFEYELPVPANYGGAIRKIALTLNGVTQLYPEYNLSQVFVNASTNNNTAEIVTNTSFAFDVPKTVSVGNHGAAILGGPYIQMTGFDTVDAHLGSSDFGLLQGTPGVQNVFNGEAFFANMNSPLPGAYYQISGAATIYAYSPGGFDQANLYTGNGSATFTVSGTAFSSMAGTADGAAFFDEAVGFANNDGFAENKVPDTAIYYDSPANDTFVATSTFSYMQSNAADGTLTELDEAQGFAQTYAYSFVGGMDVAYNYDPQHVHTTGFIVLT
jgi:hypothetical protein